MDQLPLQPSTKRTEASATLMAAAASGRIADRRLDYLVVVVTVATPAYPQARAIFHQGVCQLDLDLLTF